MRRALLLALASLLAPAAPAADEFPDLPPAALVERALRAHPAVRAAVAGVELGEAGRDLLDAGPHEFNLRLGGASRRDNPADRRYRESEIGIERALRLPGKAAKDAEIGAATLDQARSAHGDALHETGRLLLKSWFDWRRAQAAVAEWREQLAILAQQEDVAARRVKAGDAARLELLLAQAQHTQAAAQLAQAEHRLRQAADELALQFPALPLPERPADPEPRPVPGDFEEWRERILEHSHELAVARLGSRRQQLVAQRTDANRVPDPTVGMNWASDRGGQERVIGLQLTIPLPGAARAATARGAQAEAAVAAAQEARVLAKVEGEARRAWQQAQAAYAQWQRMDDIAQRTGENARLLDKAWRLGEGQLFEVQNARRQAIDARLAARQARFDAQEARYRLLLDTHRLWPLDDGHDATR